MTFVLERVYSSGDHEAERRDGWEQVVWWVEFNENWRPGCALIVCGFILPNTGYPLAQQQARELLNRGCK